MYPATSGYKILYRSLSKYVKSDLNLYKLRQFMWTNLKCMLVSAILKIHRQNGVT